MILESDWSENQDNYQYRDNYQYFGENMNFLEIFSHGEDSSNPGTFWDNFGTVDSRRGFGDIKIFVTKSIYYQDANNKRFESG